MRLALLALLATPLAAPMAIAAAQTRGPDTAPDTARQRELTRLVRQDCGSCHGMRLTGGLGLPLTPEALRDKPLESLEATIHGGRPGTAMPPWKTILSESEIRWIVQQLIAGFPRE